MTEQLWAASIAKEVIRDLYRHADRAGAERSSTTGSASARCGIAEIERLAATIVCWRSEVLNFFDSRLTNGPTEARNLIIKSVRRSGHGFRNFENYRLRVLYRCSRHA